METYYQKYQNINFPRTKLLLRSKEGTQSFYGPPSIQFPNNPISLNIEPDNCELSGLQLKSSPIISPNGIYVAYLINEQDITIYNTETGIIVSRIPCQDAESIEFSPLGTFLLTWSRPIRSQSNQENRENLKVWHVLSSSLVASYNQRTYRKGLLQWVSDETTCMRLVTNEVHQLSVYISPENSSSISLKRVSKVHHANVNDFSIGPNINNPFVALFTPEHSGRTARVSLYRYNPTLTYTAESESGSGSTNHVDSFVDVGVSRSLFSANECKMFWRPISGDTVLVQTSSDVDTSGNSYYGQSGLFIVSIDGNVSRPVPQSKDGAVYCVQWSPNGSCFIVAAGKMPCHVTLFNPLGEPTYEFGALYRDVVSFSPHGRFLCLAGFGNLGGDMNFYEISENKRKQIGTASSHAAIGWGWSPDSRYFMTSTLTPRMNVDNGFKIFKYNGEGPIYEHKQDNVYDVLWIPRPVSDYPDRARSPNSRSGDGALKVDNETKTEVKKPASTPYRPPGSTGSLAEMLRREKEGPKGKVVGNTATTNSNSTQANKPRRTIPGLPPPAENNNTKQGNKNQQNKQQQPQQPKISNQNNSASSSATAAAAAPPPLPPASNSIVDQAVAAADLDKKKKALNKKLKQIEELKTKQASGETLNAEQLNKITTESELRQELANLNI